MNYMKIQCDIMKSLSGVRTINDWLMIDGMYNNRVWVCYKGIAIYGIPEKDFMLDRQAICYYQNKRALGENSITNLLSRINSQDGSRCEYSHTKNHDKLKIVTYKDLTGSVWHGDEKLFKYDDGDTNNYYYMVNDRTPLLMYNGADVEAIILPITNVQD